MIFLLVSLSINSKLQIVNNLNKYKKIVRVCYLRKHNSLPININNKNIKNNFLKKLLLKSNIYSLNTKYISNLNYPFWIFLHENFFFTKFFKTKTTLQHINVQSLIPQGILPYIMYSTKAINWRRYRIIHSNEIIEILFLSLWLKNSNMFMRWVRYFFEKNDLKKHKKLFLLLDSLLGKVIWNFNLFLKLKGLKLSMRGKFGKAGSVRKTRRYIKKGKCTSTSKNIAMFSQTKVIRTLTGVYSLKLELFY